VQETVKQFPLVDLNGRSILVTGGTGSFGQAFLNFVTKRYTPKRLVVFSRDELKQYEMQQSFNQDYLS
jgi:UDP-N-acetylglucosamine 4,6-dehydratase